MPLTLLTSVDILRPASISPNTDVADRCTIGQHEKLPFRNYSDKSVLSFVACNRCNRAGGDTCALFEASNLGGKQLDFDYQFLRQMTEEQSESESTGWGH
jgi:hypothetical protein